MGASSGMTREGIDRTSAHSCILKLDLRMSLTETDLTECVCCLFARPIIHQSINSSIHPAARMMCAAQVSAGKEDVFMRQNEYSSSVPSGSKSQRKPVETWPRVLVSLILTRAPGTRAQLPTFCLAFSSRAIMCSVPVKMRWHAWLPSKLDTCDCSSILSSMTTWHHDYHVDNHDDVEERYY